MEKYESWKGLPIEKIGTCGIGSDYGSGCTDIGKSSSDGNNIFGEHIIESLEKILESLNTESAQGILF